MIRFQAYSHRSFQTVKMAIVSLICATAFLSGCTGGESVDADLPKPGEMRVISVEPISQGPSDLDNLIPNGNFGEWWAGAPGPDHFILPPANFSTMERVALDQGRFACAQTWKRIDRKSGKDKRLHVLVPNIKANTEYEFSVEAQSVDGCTVLIDIYECNPKQTEFEMFRFDNFTVPPDATVPTWFKVRFTTKKGGCLAIYPGTVDEKTPPGKIIWHKWHLREVAGGEAPAKESAIPATPSEQPAAPAPK